jgi:hypothetical protein
MPPKTVPENPAITIGQPIKLEDHDPTISANAAKLAELLAHDSRLTAEINSLATSSRADTSANDANRILAGASLDTISALTTDDEIATRHKQRRAIAEAIRLLEIKDRQDRRAAANSVAEKVEPLVRARFKRLVNSLTDLIEASDEYEQAAHWLDGIGAMPRRGVPNGITPFLGGSHYHGYAVSWLREALDGGHLIRTELPEWYFECTADRANGDPKTRRAADARGTFRRARHNLRRAEAEAAADKAELGRVRAGVTARLEGAKSAHDDALERLGSLGIPTPAEVQ